MTILPAPPGPAMAIVGLPGRHVIASSAREDWLRERLAGDLMGPLSPAFVVELAAALGRVDDGVDVVLAAPGLGGGSRLRELSAAAHPRAARASAHRIDTRVFGDAAGEAVVVLGRGLALRHELSFEVTPSARGRGVGRRVLHEARRLLAPDALMFAQVAPANAASLRALLHAGFTPIGAEVLFFKGERATA